jgi:mRNA interferase RelE/StbE
MIWNIDYLPEAEKDLIDLDNSVKIQILKKILKVSEHPKSDGHGKPLAGSLSGCYKIKFQSIGKRVVYKLVETDGIMLIIIISARADNEVYIEAEERLKKYNL